MPIAMNISSFWLPKNVGMIRAFAFWIHLRSWSVQWHVVCC